MKKNLITSLQQAVDQAQEASTEGGVLVIHIRNLHTIMEVFGIEYAYHVLDKFQTDLQHFFNDRAHVFYAKRAFFYIVFPQLLADELAEHAHHVYEFIRYFCCATREDSSRFVLLASLGSVLFPTHGTKAEDILDKAYISVRHAAHESEKFYYPYEATLAHVPSLKQELDQAHILQCSVLKKQICLAYQPIIDARTGEALYYETLLRLIDSEQKVISAGPYIPIAEKLGFVDAIDEAVLAMVIQEMKESKKACLSLNISGLGIDNPRWFQTLKHELEAHPEMAQQLMIEITETAAQRDLGRTAYFIAQMQELGCRIALDDFGAGNTSLRQLKSLSIDIIKIDGSLIRNIMNHSDNRIFVQMLIDIAQKFGLTTIAECVENGETARMLMEMGIHCFQGVYFGAPVPHRPWYGSEPYHYDG